jgi:hypothetical protein
MEFYPTRPAACDAGSSIRKLSREMTRAGELPAPSGRLRIRSEGVHWRAIDGEVVILDAQAQRYLALNRSGAELWGPLVDGTTREELVTRLVDAYAVDGARAGADVDALLAELAARSLLAPPGPGMPAARGPSRG